MFSHLIGIPFIPGGRTLDGLDCWGVVIEVFKITSPDIIIPEVNVSYNDGSFAINNEADIIKNSFIKIISPKIPSIMAIKHHDPIYINHVGVYIGEGKFIHSRVKTGVIIDRVDSPAWKRKIEGYYIPKE